jgi:hypothetical protein
MSLSSVLRERMRFATVSVTVNRVGPNVEAVRDARRKRGDGETVGKVAVKECETVEARTGLVRAALGEVDLVRSVAHVLQRAAETQLAIHADSVGRQRR